jgi:hypothetical protein
VVNVLEEVMKADPYHPAPITVHSRRRSLAAPGEGCRGGGQTAYAGPGRGAHGAYAGAHRHTVGQWAQAAKQNQDAIAADKAYRAISPKQGFYHIYMAHNNQFLSFANMMRGRRVEAMTAMNAMITGVPKEFIENMGPAIDGYLVIKYECPMRFGMWDELLKEPAPHPNLPILNAFWHYSRAIAMAAKGDVDGAIAEQKVFHQAVDCSSGGCEDGDQSRAQGAHARRSHDQRRDRLSQRRPGYGRRRVERSRQD